MRFVNDVARRFGPDDLLVFEQPKSIHLLSLPLWAVHGLTVLELARFKPDPERLQHFARGLARRATATSTSSTPRTPAPTSAACSWSAWSRSRSGPSSGSARTARKPRGPEFRSFSFTVSRVVPPEEIQVPPLPEVDVGGSDDVQVSGFYDKEGGAGLTYRWTGPCASVYLPGARPGATLVVRRRPAGARPRAARRGHGLA